MNPDENSDHITFNRRSQVWLEHKFKIKKGKITIMESQTT